MDSERKRVLDKIHASGYWRVVIRPDEYDEARVPSLSKCRQLVEEAAVRLRGWDYPHISQEGPRAGQSWIEDNVDWQYGHIEWWRMYLSGQFVHHFAMREEYEESSRDVKGLDFINTVFTFTEVCEFAARLAARGVLSRRTELDVSLHDCDGRKVISWDRGRYLSMDYVCALESITYSRSLDTADLVADSAKIALEGTVFVLERFNWLDVPTGILAEEQSKLLERRRD